MLFPRHFKDDASKKNTINLIHTFRDYLHYHIKCSKVINMTIYGIITLPIMIQAYLHSRMRARTNALLKVLNRARPEVKVTEKKTIS